MITGGRRRAAASHRVPAQLSVRAMAKKGRVARILTTLHRVAGTPISEALKRRQRSATQRGDAGTHGEKSEWKKRKERKARREAFEGAATQTGLPHGYHAGQRILCVGEGNFSFALALTTLFDGEGVNVLATSFDKTGVARASYRDAKDIAHALEATGAGVRHGVDVQEIDALKLVAKEWWAMGNDPEYAADRERRLSDSSSSSAQQSGMYALGGPTRPSYEQPSSQPSTQRVRFRVRFRVRVRS